MFRAPRRAAVCFVLAMFLLSFSKTASGASFTWNDTTGNWSVGGNWGGSAPTGSDPTDILTFGGTGATAYTATNNVANPFLLNQIILNSTATATEVIAGTQLRFSGSGAAVTQNGSGAFTLSTPIHFSVPTLFDGSGAGQISLTGQLTGGSMVTKSSSGTLEIFNSSGTTVNTFFGGFTVNAGTLYVRPVNSPRVATYTLRANPITLGSGGTLFYNGTGGSTTLAELRIGEISGSGTVNMTGGNGLALTMLADATSSATVTAGQAGAGSGVAIYVRGIGTQSFTGSTVGIIEPINVYRGAGMTFSGTGTTAGVLGNTSDVDLDLFGGTMTFDNTGGNTTSTWGRISNATVVNLGGGKLAYVGHSSGSAETVGGFALLAGASTVSVTNNGGTGAALTFTDSGSLRDVTSGVINFVGLGTGTLGSAGDNPRITFTGTLTTNTTNGMLSNATAATASTIGWATVNTSSWAGVGANGIVALADTNRTSVDVGSAGAWELTNLQGSATLGGSLTVGAMKLSPTGSGQALTIGIHNLATTALMLTGSTDYAITGSGTLTGSATRYIYVNDANTALTTSMVIASGGSNPTNKAGAGFLVLDSTVSQNTLTSTIRLNLLAGTLRGNNTQLNFSQSATNGVIAFRGGVLEINGGGDGTGASADFRRSVTTAAGGVNWGSSTDTGNGGFSAFGSNASVNLGGAASPSTVTWGAGTFVQDDYVLLFGSTKANARIRLLNPLALDSGSVNAYQARNIHVIDNPDSTADYAQLAGLVSSYATSDLLKTGSGTLELAGNNASLNGGVIVAEGTLLLGNNGALGNSAYVLLGARGGAANASLLTNGAFSTARELTVIAGNTGVTSIGGNTDHNATFSGNIVLQKDVRLASVTTGGNSVVFSGVLSGAANVTADGGGVVQLSAANSFGGSGKTLTVQGGTTVVASTGANGGNSNLGGNNTGLTFDNGTLRFAAAFDPSGRTVTIDGGGATLDTNGYDVTFANAIGNSGTGGLIKAGTGTLALAGGSYTGSTVVQGGTLQVNGSIVSSSDVTLALNTNLTGSGTVSGVSGGGTISPGVNGAGILTAESVNALAGTSFEFEFNQYGAPTWAAPAASGNDVLALTVGSVPTLLESNIIDVYFNIGDENSERVFLGGFYTTDTADFLANVEGATINYFDNNVALEASKVTLSTVEANGGRVLQFTIAAVPEPGAAATLAAFGLLPLTRRRRRR